MLVRITGAVAGDAVGEPGISSMASAMATHWGYKKIPTLLYKRE